MRGSFPGRDPPNVSSQTLTTFEPLAYLWRHTQRTTPEAMNNAPAFRTFADQRIGEITEQAKAEGLKVYTFDAEGPIRQVYITDGEKIATLSTRNIICIGTGTVHKPCRECGTGFGMNTSDEHPVDIDAIREAMNTQAPKWATRKQRAAVRKYANWEEYTASNAWTTYTQL